MVASFGRVLAALAVCLLLGALGGGVGRAASQDLRVLVVKLDWGNAPSMSDGQIASVASDAAAFYRTASFGQLTLSFGQTPWLSVSEGQVTCSTLQQLLASLARLRSVAAGAGYDPSGYDRVVFLIPSVNCPFSGIYEPQGIVLNGALEDGMLIHELGHSLGMGHAGSVNCRYTPTNRFCTNNLYGDDYDVMGNSEAGQSSLPPGDFGAVQKVRAGWITPSYIAHTGSYQLAALEEPSSLPQALVIRTKGMEYWIDYREAAGNDVYLKSDPLGITKGFEVHRFAGRLLPVGDTSPKSPLFPVGPDYLLPREVHRHNTYATPPGSTFTEPGLFSLTALRRTASTITIRFRWLKRR